MQVAPNRVLSEFSVPPPGEQLAMGTLISVTASEMRMDFGGLIEGTIPIWLAEIEVGTIG